MAAVATALVLILGLPGVSPVGAGSADAAVVPGRATRSIDLTPAGVPVAPAGVLAGVPVAPVRRAPPTGAYRWPLDGKPSVVRPFQPPPQPWLPGHRGVDLAAVSGASVFAAGAGVVRFAGSVAGRGVLSVEHPGGLRTTYEPVTALVRAGQVVAAGTPLGAVTAGHPGCPAATCLHWGLRSGELYLDPLSLLGRGRVRLLPMGGYSS